MTTANAILIYEEHGQVKHRFCPEAEARNCLAIACKEMKGGTMFATDGMDAAVVHGISPEFREHVEESKRKMRVHMRFRDALDRNGVPRDINLRQSIFKAFEDLKQAA